MNRTITIILNFINQAAAPLRAAVGQIQTAVTGTKTQLTNLASHARWASLFIGGALVKVAGDAIDMAAKFERFGKAAEYLTGSAAAAKEFAARTREVARATMFNIDEIAEMNSRLVGNTKNVKLSGDTLMVLSDAVAATGGSYGELEGAVRAWIQTNSKAKASAEELNRQFANANIPVLRNLAESIEKDANHPLRKYLAAAGGATGASKTLTTAFKGASEKLPILKKSLEKANLELERFKKIGKQSKEGELAKELAVDKARLAYDKANKSIGEYNNAQAKSVKGGAAAKLTVDQIMGQLQEIGKLNIPGSVMAPAISRALKEAYGGANAALVNTFSFQISQLKDNFKLVTLSLLGLDEGFKATGGGILNLLTQAIKPLNEFLMKNEEAITKFVKSISNSMPVLVAIAAFFIGVLYGALAGILAPILLAGIQFALFGAAVGLVVAALKSAWDSNWLGMRDTINNIITWIQGTFIPGLERAFKQDLPAAIDAAKVKFEEIKRFIDEHKGALEAAAVVLTFVFGPALATVAGTAMVAFIKAIALGIIQVISMSANLFITTARLVASRIAALAMGAADVVAALTRFAAGGWAINSAFAAVAITLLGVYATLKLMAEISDKLAGKGSRFNLKEQFNAANELWFGGMLPSLAVGGTVPGPIGSPTPIIAHGGERVIPVGGSSGASPTVNINISGSFNLDDPSRINELASLIGRTLGRQMELARWGAGW